MPRRSSISANVRTTVSAYLPSRYLCSGRYSAGTTKAAGFMASNGTGSIVQDDAQQRAVDLQRQLAVVLEEGERLERVQEEMHRRRRRPDHVRQRFLRDPGDDAAGRLLVSIARQQQQRARQPLLGGVEQLIDQVLFDPNVARQHVGDEAVGHGMLLVQQPDHLPLADEQHRARADRGGGPHAEPLPREAALAEEIPGAEHRHDRLPAGLRQHRQLDAARLNVHDVFAGISLREDGGAVRVLGDRFRDARGVEKRLHVEVGHGSMDAFRSCFEPHQLAYLDRPVTAVPNCTPRGRLPERWYGDVLAATLSEPIHLGAGPPPILPAAAVRPAGIGGTVSVATPGLPWPWQMVLMDALRLLAAAWSVPLAMLLVGVPIALTIAVVLWLGQLAGHAF